jgi:hypothetical protein
MGPLDYHRRPEDLLPRQRHSLGQPRRVDDPALQRSVAFISFPAGPVDPCWNVLRTDGRSRPSKGANSRCREFVERRARYPWPVAQSETQCQLTSERGADDVDEAPSVAVRQSDAWPTVRLDGLPRGHCDGRALCARSANRAGRSGGCRTAGFGPRSVPAGCRSVRAPSDYSAAGARPPVMLHGCACGGAIRCADSRCHRDRMARPPRRHRRLAS